ncbi:hypothetical protein KKG71_00075 [Patescibacteria group bacterium]|nr:hypothetical protein [Patescibacteria group bacterium]
MDNSTPYQTSPLTIVYKILAGFLGGTIGSGALLLVFSGASSLLQPVLNQESDTVAPIILMVFMVMVFAASISANIVSNVLMGLSEREKYSRLATTIFQTFLLNLVIFIFTAPIYLLITNIDLQMIAVIAGLQVILSVIASSIILELISNSKYGLIGLYAAVLGTIVALVINILVYRITGSEFVTMFTALPILWAAIGLFNAVLNILYFQLYKFYGVDFLSSKESFGGDSSQGGEDDEETEGQEESSETGGGNKGEDEPISEQEIYEATTKDEKGGEFLRK